MYNIGRSTSGSSRDICKAPRGPGQGTQVSQKYLFSLVNLNYIADAPKYTFSKALATVTLCSKYTIALTFDIFSPFKGNDEDENEADIRKSPLYSGFYTFICDRALTFETLSFCQRSRSRSHSKERKKRRDRSRSR